MSTERVTVTLPDEVRRAVQRLATEQGVSFSSIVNQALNAWMRGKLIDAWLAEHQATYGAFDETELRTLAEEAGVPYLPPGRASETAA